MFDLGNLEVTVVISLDALTRTAPTLPHAYMHQVRLSSLSEDPESLTYTVENHLAEHLPDEQLTLTPDRTDSGDGPTFTVTGADGVPWYAVGITLASRSLEPAVSCEQWGIKDIAAFLSITPVAVRAYLSRGKMPTPDGYISGSPWWNADRIREWPRPGARVQSSGLRRR